jgi:hypothetical protein
VTSGCDGAVRVDDGAGVAADGADRVGEGDGTTGGAAEPLSGGGSTRVGAERVGDGAGGAGDGIGRLDTESVDAAGALVRELSVRVPVAAGGTGSCSGCLSGAAGDTPEAGPCSVWGDDGRVDSDAPSSRVWISGRPHNARPTPMSTSIPTMMAERLVRFVRGAIGTDSRAEKDESDAS